jgi:hypothetical protein
VTIRQLRYHDNSGTTWLCGATGRHQVVTSGGISQANQINALLRDGETQDKRAVGPPDSVFLIQALINEDAVAAGLGPYAATLDGYEPAVAAKIWGSPADDDLYGALPVSADNVAPDDDCAWAG